MTPRGSQLLARLVLILVTACGGSSDRPTPDAALPAPDASNLLAVTVRVHVPETTPAGASIYITGNFQNWDPGAAAYRLTDVGAGTYEIQLAFAPGTQLEFNITRGSLATVERGPKGEEIAKRTFEVNTPLTIDFAVGGWADDPTTTAIGDVTKISVPAFFGGRRVWVYLPPGYHQSSARYPVLYMFDGQNVFDRFTSFVGEWKVDETLEAGIASGELAPLIVVAADHGGTQRILEYTPWSDGQQGGGGAATLAAFTDVLVPYIDANYRTLTGAANRGVAGASLGGLMALYASYARPDVFGRNAAMSPSIWWDGRMIVSYAAGLARPAARVWMDMGTVEYDEAIGDLEAMRAVMLAQGFVLDADLKVVEDVGAGHNEAAWSRRFPDVVKFLFPKP